MSEGNPAPERPDPVMQWVLASSGAAYGVFHSEQGAWDFCARRGLSPTLFHAIPLLSPMIKLDVEALHRALEE